MVKCLQNHHALLQHVESRRPRRRLSTSTSGAHAMAPEHLEFFIQFEAERDDAVSLLKALKHSSAVQDFTVVTNKQVVLDGEHYNYLN